MNKSPFKINKLADFGSSEPWVARIWMGIPELVDVLPFPENERKEINDKIGDIASELSLAFIALRKIKDLESKKDKTIMEVKKEYSDLYDHLWRAYKDRFQEACKSLGYDIGFLFQNDENFENKSKEFIKNNPNIPDDFRKMLKGDRKVWQNGLSDFRNYYLQHKKIGQGIENMFYKLNSAQNIFDNVWQVIEDSFVILIQSKLEKTLVVVEIPEKDRDPAYPKRFRMDLKNKSLI